MPRDLFGDVSDPSVRVGSRKWYTVPLSLAAHAAVLVAIVIVPLLAAGTLPAPDTIEVWVAPPSLPQPPPPPPRKRAAPPASTVSQSAAPVEVPPTIGPEVAFDSGLHSDDLGVDGGVPDGIVIGTDPLPPPPPPPAPREPVPVGGKIAPPQRVRDARPAYPPIAQAARVEGTVIIQATIDEHGRVSAARVLHSIPLLDQAALDAVGQWEYSPTRLNGVPVAVIMTVTVRFQLK